jgi:3-deoxy-D-manno-octulosonic-acid transferase
MFFAYSLLFTLGLIVFAPFYVWRYRGTSQVGASWRERLGWLPEELKQAKRGSIWIHAVSVGETLAISGLVRKLQVRFPDRPIFVSHVTPTGRAAGRSRLSGIQGQFYAPLDWDFAVRRILHSLQPSLLVIVETEIWPNLVRTAHCRGTAVAFVNARLSDRSFKGYRLVHPFIQRVLHCADAVFAQTEEDAMRFRALGARPERVSAAGNLKFDFEPPPQDAFSTSLQDVLTQEQRGPILIAASTMPGEEGPIIKAWTEVQKVYAKALLILAPRHPARFQAVAEELQAQGQGMVRRTALTPDKASIRRGLAAANILLLDTIGELAGLFRLANLVFMGGTLVATGGHNILEPAYWAKPILLGPHMENFREISRIFQDQGAVVQVQDEKELGVQILCLLRDEPRCKALGEAARRVLTSSAGATDRIVSGLSALLSERGFVPLSAAGGKRP